MSQEEIKKKIIKRIEPKLEAVGLGKDDLDIDESLLTQGILDSISFLELILELEAAFAIQIDFGELDPSEFTSVSSLSNLIKASTTEEIKGNSHD